MFNSVQQRHWVSSSFSMPHSVDQYDRLDPERVRIPWGKDRHVKSLIQYAFKHRELGKTWDSQRKTDIMIWALDEKENLKLRARWTFWKKPLFQKKLQGLGVGGQHSAPEEKKMSQTFFAVQMKENECESRNGSQQGCIPVRHARIPLKWRKTKFFKQINKKGYLGQFL